MASNRQALSFAQFGMLRGLTYCPALKIEPSDCMQWHVGLTTGIVETKYSELLSKVTLQQVQPRTEELRYG